MGTITIRRLTISSAFDALCQSENDNNISKLFPRDEMK